ncbi:hypothetical protein SEPCBS57363_000821 [Sporothrix epigloea]|uniref:Uncharacterized protein n=1 Tax=Sporothrix epigloea TaxID=1892477 RepID=A0ABP0D7T5_9PEZI
MDGMLENMTDILLHESHEGIMEHLSRHSRRTIESWACEDCEQIHDLDQKDVPLAKGMDAVYGRDHITNTAAKYHASKTQTEHLSGISHRHVQLSLKLTRLAFEGYSYYSDYRRKLTETYAIADKETMDRADHISLAPRSDGLPNSFTPRVARDSDGCLRFLLQTIYQIGGDHDPAQQKPAVIDVCPHKQISNLGQLAASPKHNSGSCKHCSTSYMITATQVRIIEDFGIEGSPADPHWHAHLDPKVKRQGVRHTFLAKSQSLESLFDAPIPDCESGDVSESGVSESGLKNKMRLAASRLKHSLSCSSNLYA